MVNSAIIGLIGNIISSIVGSVLTLVLIIYLNRNRKQNALPENIPILSSLKSGEPGWQVARPLFLALLVSAGLSTFATPIALRLRDGHLSMVSLFGVFPEILLEQLGWTLLNYFVWGGLSLFVYAMAHRRTEVDYRIFTTAGFLGGVFHQSACCLVAFYMGQFLLSKATAAELYDLVPRALFQLWFHFLLESLSAGILLSYYLTIASRLAFVREFYLNRYKIAFILVALLTFVYPAVLGLGPGSLVTKALRYNNVGLVWWAVLIICIVSVLAGTEVFERAIRPKLLGAAVREVQPKKREQKVSRKHETKRTTTKNHLPDVPSANPLNRTAGEEGGEHEW